ncbi:MAG: PAS domain S-box protein [Desulfobacterales bacterium]
MSDIYTILIVEDDPGLTSYLKRLLRPKTLTLITADSSRQAIQYLNQNTIDLVLLDIGLPDMDGYQVMDHICKKLPHTLVIVMTGEITVESAVKALRKGAYDYLRKPFESTELLNTIDNALDRIRLEHEHRKAEQKLRESEEKYHQLFESESDAIMVVDAVTKRFEEANRAAQLLYGYSHEEFLALMLEDISAEPEKTRAKLESIRKGEMGSSIVHYRYFKKKDGTVFPGELSLATYASMGCQKIIGAVRDITERKQTEEALRKSEQQFRDLIENSPVGISIYQDDRFVYQNPEQMKINGPSCEKNIFQDLEKIFPDDLDKVKTAYRRILKGEVSKIEVDFRFFRTGPKNVKADMRWVWCRAIAFNYYGKDAVLINAIDITKAKQLEHQLLIKNKMLSLGRVAAGIAHEIRNPLTGINTYLYTIEDLCDSEHLDPEDMEVIRQIVTQIQVASNKIESVIKRVMDFSKPGAPKMMRTNINESLEEAIELSSVTMRKYGIKIEKSLAPDLPQCYADPHLIEQVVLNLITNAARAMEKSNGTKFVEIKSSAQNNTLSIRVADSGPGVPIELREKIFDPFFTTKDDGSGIGLNIAQRIVADHNGSISLDSSKWGGAEFKIELPIERRIINR